MRNLNKQLKDLYGVTDADYAEWCRKNGKRTRSAESRKDFYDYIRKGKLGE